MRGGEVEVGAHPRHGRGVHRLKRRGEVAEAVERHRVDFDQREDEGVDDLVDRLAGLHRPAEVGAGLLVDGGTGPVTVPGGVDGATAKPYSAAWCRALATSRGSRLCKPP